MGDTWAAKVLEDVTRIYPWHNEDAYIKEADALAALAKLAEWDDARLIADCELAAKVLADTGTFETGQSILREAAAHIAALTAQVAEAQAKVAAVTSDRAYIIGANAGWEAAVEHDEASPAAAAMLAQLEAAEAEAAALRDRVEKDAKAHEKEIAVWAENYAALTAQNREMALDVLASSGQAQEAYAAQLAAEAEVAALRAKVARLEGELTDMPKAVLRTTVCQGPVWPDDRPGVWLAALEACAKSVQEAVDAALTDGGSDDKPTVEQIIHLYGVDALCKALAPVIVQEADVNKTPKCERDLGNVLTESAALRAKVAQLEEKAVLWIEQGMVIVAPESVPQRRALESYRKQFATLVRAALADGGKDE